MLLLVGVYAESIACHWRCSELGIQLRVVQRSLLGLHVQCDGCGVTLVHEARAIHCLTLRFDEGNRLKASDIVLIVGDALT